MQAGVVGHSELPEADMNNHEVRDSEWKWPERRKQRSTGAKHMQNGDRDWGSYKVSCLKYSAPWPGWPIKSVTAIQLGGYEYKCCNTYHSVSQGGPVGCHHCPSVQCPETVQCIAQLLRSRISKSWDIILNSKSLAMNNNSGEQMVPSMYFYDRQ